MGKDKYLLSPFPLTRQLCSAEIAAPEFNELDSSDMPEEMDAKLWARFLERRRNHMLKEVAIRDTSDEHARMIAHLEHLEGVVDGVGAEVAAVSARITEASVEVMRRRRDTEVAIRSRQGKVEIEESPVVTDLTDVEMIQTFIVGEFNTAISKLGREKVGILKDISSSRTASTLQTWDQKRLALEHEDATDLTTELQLLRVTKSLQVLIKMGGQENQQAVELQKLDRKIEYVATAEHEKTQNKKQQMLGVKQKTQQQKQENQRLLETVQELEAAVKERVQINAIREGGSQDTRKAGDTRMQALVTRRKLVDLCKLQAEEIKFLRDQVESLRQRTFASFHQTVHPANPDERSPHTNVRPESRAAR
jgi:hypothetical protein